MCFFCPLKEHLAGKQFAADSNTQHTVILSLKALDTDSFCSNINALMSWWDKYA
jgi:hypothetical protein